MDPMKTANILIVDDITANLALLSDIVKQIGYVARPVNNVARFNQAMKEQLPQLILLDTSLPEISGYELCREIKSDSRTRDIPIIFISALMDANERKKGFQAGAVDFISKPFDVDEIRSRIHVHIKNYTMNQELEQYNRRLQKMMSDHIKKVAEDEKRLIFLIARLAETRKDALGAHLENVASNARLLAQSLQFSPAYEKEVSNSFIEEIEKAAPLHDLGEITISDRILLKRGKLTPDEYDVLKTHAEVGARYLMEVYSGNEYNHYLKMAIDVAYYHHERWDGGGYPRGLKGEEIPLSARITAVVDVYDTLLRENCYKEAMDHESAMDIMNNEAGKSFDPGIIEVLNKIQRRLKRP